MNAFDALSDGGQHQLTTGPTTSCPVAVNADEAVELVRAGRARLDRTGRYVWVLWCCLVCETSWAGRGPCPNCEGEGRRGELSDYCPHGHRRPYRGWPCRACRESFIETHRNVGPRHDNPGSAY